VSLELLATARLLAKASPKRPRQSDLKRAISTAYYALFDELARDAANLLVGVGVARADKAWTQTYRALDHSAAKKACGQLRTLGFPPELCECGDMFVQLQQARHDADYDPDHRVSRAEALNAIQSAATAIQKLAASSRRDRKAFAVQLLLKRR
jgi:uncharacterized protein (UPF0332 family)